MRLPKHYVEAILKTLPVGYYLRRNLSVKLKDDIRTSRINIITEEVEISMYQINALAEKYSDDIKEYEIENDIRCMLYHEVSHALLTPKSMPITRIINIFEDERIETICKKFYNGVDFKQFIIRLNNFTGEQPTSVDAMFYHLVRYRVGPKHLLDEVRDIIRQYSHLNCSSTSYSYYIYRIEELYKLVKEEFEKLHSKPEDTFSEDVEEDKEDESSTSDDTHFDEEDDEDLEEDDEDLEEDDEDLEEDDEDDEDLEDEEFDEESNEEDTSDEEDEEESDDNSIEEESNEEDNEEDDEDEEFDEDLEDEENNSYIYEDNEEDELNDNVISSAIEELHNVLSQYDNSKIEETLSQIIYQHKSVSKNTGSAINSYSGRFNPRLCSREDCRFFVQQNRQGNYKHFSKLHINLFIDVSGSFYRSETIVNQLLFALHRLEKQNADFSFDLVTCQMGEKLQPKDNRKIHCYGGNDLDNRIFSIYNSLQYKDKEVYNIVLFDGDAFSDSHDRREAYKNFGAFNHNNTTIISDCENEHAIRKYAPSAKTTITSRYTEMLFETVFSVLRQMLR